MNFLPNIMKFDRDTTNDETVELLHPYTSAPDFSPQDTANTNILYHTTILYYTTLIYYTTLLASGRREGGARARWPMHMGARDDLLR